METLFALAIGIVAGSGVYLLLRRSLFHVLLGVAMISQAANLTLFTAAGLGSGGTAIIPPGEETLPEGHPDPLAQALVLTAIVISFGVLAFCLVLLNRARQVIGNSDVAALRSTEP